VRFLIEESKELLNVPLKDGRMPIVVAILHSDVDFVTFLMEQGATLNHSNGSLCLFAYLHGKTRPRPVTVKFLLENGVNYSGVDLNGDTILHACVNMAYFSYVMEPNAVRNIWSLLFGKTQESIYKHNKDGNNVLGAILELGINQKKICHKLLGMLCDKKNALDIRHSNPMYSNSLIHAFENKIFNPKLLQSFINLDGDLCELDSEGNNLLHKLFDSQSCLGFRGYELRIRLLTIILKRASNKAKHYLVNSTNKKGKTVFDEMVDNAFSIMKKSANAWIPEEPLFLLNAIRCILPCYQVYTLDSLPKYAKQLKKVCTTINSFYREFLAILRKMHQQFMVHACLIQSYHKNIIGVLECLK